MKRLGLIFVLSLVSMVVGTGPLHPHAVGAHGSPKGGAVVMPTERTPPTAKDALLFLIRSHDVRLSVHPSCKGVGTDFQDNTIGEYISGFWAEQVEADGKNWVEAGCREGEKPKAPWSCRIILHRMAGEEQWGWGVSFSVRKSDRAVLRESFRCVGGG
jgi:hypothetical protein